MSTPRGQTRTLGSVLARLRACKSLILFSLLALGRRTEHKGSEAARSAASEWLRLEERLTEHGLPEGRNRTHFDC